VPAVLSKLVNQLPQRAVGQAELLGNVLPRSPFDKHGAEGFVAALIRIGWASEKVPASGVVHDPDSPENVSPFVERNRAQW
jgi:hypothetical protein